MQADNDPRHGTSTKPNTVRANLKAMNMVFFCLLGFFMRIVSSMNLLTGFPDDLYISKEDSVGFLLKDFINGTRITREVFPEPFVKSPLDDDSVEISQEILVNCRFTRQARPLEMISICKDSNQKDTIVVHHLNSDLSLMLKYENKIQSDSAWEAGEILTNVYYHNGLFFASSKIFNALSARFKVKVYVFELFYPNNPGERYDNKNKPPRLDLIGAPFVINEFMTQQEGDLHPIIRVNCVSDSQDFFHCLVCQETQSYEFASSKKISIFKILKQSGKYSIGASQVHTLANSIDEASLWDDKTLAYSHSGDLQITFLSYSDNTRNLLPSPLIASGEKIDLKVSPSGETKTADFKSDIISWNQKYIRQNQLESQPEVSRYSSVLAVVNQDTFFYCEDIKINVGTAFSLKNDCKVQIRMKFSKYEQNDANFFGKSWLISELYIEPYLKKAIVGYLYDDGGSAEKVLKRDGVKGYMYIDIEQSTIQFKDLSQYQASSIGFFNTNYYILNQNNKRYVYSRRDDEIQVTPPQNKDKYEMKLQANTINTEEQENYMDFDFFTINSNVNILKGDYEFVKMNPIIETTVYDKGWFDLGMNGKTLYGNNPTLEVKFQDHDLPNLQQQSRDIEMVHDAVLSDSNIMKLFILPVASTKFGDEFYNRNEDIGKQVYSKVYLFIQFERSKLPPVSFPVIILECRFPTFEKSGVDGEKKFLLEHYIKDEDPTDIKFDWKKGKSVCTIKQSYENQFDDLKVESVISNKDFFSIIGKKIAGKSAETWLNIIELNSKTPEIFGKVKLEDYDAYCDQQVFSVNIFVICNYGNTNADPEIVNLIGRSSKTGISVSQIMIAPKEVAMARVKIYKKFVIIPENNGVPKFKRGQTIFFGGSSKKAYIVNNHVDSSSILVVDFESVGDGLYSSISSIIPINKKALVARPTDTLNFQICPTLNNLVIFNPMNSFIYGINTLATKTSFLNIPTSTADGVQREIVKMGCSDSDESFQLWLNNKQKGTSTIVTYYGFDGTQGTKKIHSEFAVNSNLNEFTFASLVEYGQPALLSFVYSTSSIFLNQTTLINVNGPQALIKTDGVVPGKYQLNMTLSNQKTNIDQALNVTVLSSTEVFLSNVFPPKANLNKGYVIKLPELINFKGDIIGMQLYDTDKPLIKVSDRLELANSFEYSSQKLIVAVSGDLVVARQIGTNTIEVMTNFNQLRKSVDMLEVASPENPARYDSCDQINVGSISNGRILLSFVCFKDFSKTIILAAIPRLAPPSPEAKTVALARSSLNFEIGEYHETIIDNYLFITVVEKIGNLVSVTRFDLEGKDQVPIRTIKSRWRKVGDNSLYSIAKFNVFRVFEKDPKKPVIDEPYILAILSPGMSYFELMRLNFKQYSIGYILDVQLYNKIPLNYIRCRGAKPVDFSEDESLGYVKEMEEPVMCFGGGSGIMFEEFFLDFKEMEDKRSYVAQKGFSYKLPMLKRYWVDNFKVTDDYILIRGDFGDYLKKSQSGEDFFTPTPGQQLKKVLPEPEKVNQENVGKLCILIFKRKSSSIHTIGPLSATSSFLAKDENGKTKLTASITQKTDQGLSLQLQVLELQEEFKVTILDDLGSSIKRLRIGVRTIDDPPYNMQLTTLVLDRDFGVENTNMLVFLFFFFIFFIAVAFYSLRWWKSNFVENSSSIEIREGKTQTDVGYLAFNDSGDTNSLISSDSRSNTMMTFDDDEAKPVKQAPVEFIRNSEWQKVEDSDLGGRKKEGRDAGLIEQKDDLGDLIFGDLVDDDEINDSQNTIGFNPAA